MQGVVLASSFLSITLALVVLGAPLDAAAQEPAPDANGSHDAYASS